MPPTKIGGNPIAELCQIAQATRMCCTCRHVLNPQQEVLLHAVVIQQIEEVVIRPLGYQWSPPISVPKLQDSLESPKRPTVEQM